MELQTSSNENITLTYTNENAKNYYQDGKITKDLKIVQDQNIIINISPATTNDMEDSYGD